MDLLQLFKEQYIRDNTTSPRMILDVCNSCQHCCINGQCLPEHECQVKYTILIAVCVVIASLLLFYFYRRRNQQMMEMNGNKSIDEEQYNEEYKIIVNEYESLPNEFGIVKNKKSIKKQNSFNHQLDFTDGESNMSQKLSNKKKMRQRKSNKKLSIDMGLGANSIKENLLNKPTNFME
ncbi:UNKNOWN [Stylonychia lemnae]|uniref:Transmembrane protein n=1 Tax=Stylonychia lemnae TaxID=5949 RepID=A0A078B334_STYLE|nr:UNKNOWN [Stylonychia lemnae]|eukprot:CDW88920.1 UNKNOWN [Stylonychia lemnae]